MNKTRRRFVNAFATGVADAEWGACMIFPKKLVSAGGVCNSWFKRAS